MHVILGRPARRRGQKPDDGRGRIGRRRPANGHGGSAATGGTSTIAAGGTSGGATASGGVAVTGGRGGSGGAATDGTASSAGAGGTRPAVTAAAGTTLVQIAPAVRRQTFESRGTSLCWWASHVGSRGATARNAVVDAVVDPVKRLGYNISSREAQTRTLSSK